jgi:CheY-like chemotaxis protein
VKNLGTHVRQVHGIAGATIMGDGSVVLIVNPSDLDREYRPRQFLASLPQSPAYTPKSLDSDRRLNVLVVDDSPSVRRVVSSIFKRVNWTSSSAKDGIEALEFLHQANEYPDAIMLDIEMPRMDGYEFLSTIRSMEGFEEIPVVMVTSRAGDKHRRKAMELGANAYLVKPYQDDQLIQIIRDIVRASAVSALY